MLPKRIFFATLVAATAAMSSPAPSAHAAWSFDGLRIAPSAGVQSDPVVAPDGVGGAFVVWQDNRSGQRVLYAQHLSSEGMSAPGWPEGGLQVSSGLDYDPFVVADGRGGAFVSGCDGRNVGLWHLAATDSPAAASVTFMAALDGTVGAPSVLEGPGPLAVTKVSPTVLPVLLADGEGGVFLVWEQGGFLSEYVRAQHYDGDGTVVPPWPAAAAYLGYGRNPVACSDGANPARDGLSVSFTLANSDPATIELFDTGGRLILRRSVESLGPGEHVLAIHGADALRPGVFLIRLTQGARARVARATVLY